MNRLKSKNVIITGASLGIGKAIGKRLAEEGANVALTDILDEEGLQLEKEINESGGNAKF